jgi:hypothetical protein
VIALSFFVAAALAWIGVMACFIGIWFAAGEVPNRPLHMRINRLNILADRRPRLRPSTDAAPVACTAAGLH